MKWHFILDTETMGSESTNCAVVDCSYVCFDWDRFTTNPYTFAELESLAQRDKLDVQHQVKDFGFKVDKSTVEWWSKLPPEVRIMAKPTKNDLTLDQFFDRMNSYLSDFPKIDYWWSRANSFDPIILWRLIKHRPDQHLINNKLKHWKLRDTRTFIDARANFPVKNGFVPFQDEAKWAATFKEHNSVHDIIADILRLQVLIRLEKDLDPVE